METERKLKSFWINDGGDFHAMLGEPVMRAVTITPQNVSHTKYHISHRSYFPFTKEQYDMYFDNIFDAAEFAESHLLRWFQSLVKPIENEQKLINNETTKLIENE